MNVLNYEMDILSGIIIDSDIIADVFNDLDASLFTRQTDKNIFNAVMALFNNNDEIDQLTIVETLEKSNHKNHELLERVNSICDYSMSSATVKRSIEKIKDHNMRKFLAEKTALLQHAIQNQSNDTTELMKMAEDLILVGSSGNDGGGFVPVNESIHRTMNKIEELQSGKNLRILWSLIFSIDLFTVAELIE